ncbi:MAG: hypothetical protein JWP97_5928 [Labilithrix sp.]|nr:hypothetical protein [Labilithrix sp.]
MWALANVFDVASPTPEPPPDLERLPIALHDLLITRHSTFDLDDELLRWVLTGTKVPFEAKPRNPYVRMGDMPPMRIDLTGREPNTPVPRSDMAKYPLLRTGGGPGPTAAAEIAIRKLALTPQELLGELIEARGAKARKPRKTTDAAKAGRFEPFELIDAGPGKACPIVWNDGAFQTHRKLFEAVGAECNGYTWTAIVTSLVRTERPELVRRLKLDPEASTVSISGPEPALEEVARMLRELLADKKALRAAVSRAAKR